MINCACDRIIVSKFENTVHHCGAPMLDTNGIGRLAMAEVAELHGMKVIIAGFPFQINS